MIAAALLFSASLSASGLDDYIACVRAKTAQLASQLDPIAASDAAMASCASLHTRAERDYREQFRKGTFVQFRERLRDTMAGYADGLRTTQSAPR